MFPNCPFLCACVRLCRGILRPACCRLLVNRCFFFFCTKILFLCSSWHPHTLLCNSRSLSLVALFKRRMFSVPLTYIFTYLYKSESACLLACQCVCLCIGWAKKWGCKLMTIILSNRNRLKKFYWKIPR